MKNKVWVEKYRPKEWKDFIFPEKDKLKKMLETPFSMPHLLLVSATPGTGKTTLGKLIIHQLKAECLVLNSSDDRKIEVVRDKVKSFASTRSTNSKVPKIVLMDELDGTPKLTQEALRNLMETFSSNCKFILTANNINKIHEAVVSRCIQLKFTEPKKSDIYIRLINICTEENLECDEAGIKKLIDIHYPSIRNIINHLQDLKNGNKSIKIENIKKQDEEFEQLWNKIKQSKFSEVREYILLNNIDVRSLNKYIWNQIINIQLTQTTALIIQQLCENEYRFSVGADYNIIFITSLIKIISLLNK